MNFEKLQECIRRRFANSSRSREALFRVLSEAGERCLGVEEIRERMLAAYPREVSVNTIYRHLEFLQECGLVRGVQAGASRVFCLRDASECYAVCRHCGTAVKITGGCSECMERIPDAELLVIYRRCDLCL
jgi:Fe2+ or Zn2+ uptake regulation protein